MSTELHHIERGRLAGVRGFSDRLGAGRTALSQAGTARLPVLMIVGLAAVVHLVRF